MDKKLVELGAVLGLVLLALAYLAIRSWRGKAIAHAKFLPELPTAFASAGDQLAAAASYVVTTFGGSPLERVMAHGLGNRGKAALYLSENGVVIERQGENALHLANASIVSVETATATLDRVVERDGLVVITWSTDTGKFDTYLRILNTEFREALISAFAKAPKAQKVG
ncbi:MAG: hypothetical protein KGL77_02130 [Actinomycetales bacterium]|nr:hypothetical protein [Actinomycetales bacterium]